MVSALRLVIDDELARAQSSSNADLGKLSTAVEQLQTMLREANPAKPDDGIPAIYKRDPYKVLEDVVGRWIEVDEQDRAEKGLSPRIHDEEAMQRRIDDLEAELVRLRGAQPHALPASDGERPIDVPTSAIMPPGEQSDRPENQRYASGADNPKVKPPTIIDAEPVTTWPDGRPLPPGGQLVDGKIVPIPPRAKSGAETRAQQDKVNADRATAHRIMTQPSRVSGEPTPSTPLNTYGDSGFIWGGEKGRAW